MLLIVKITEPTQVELVTLLARVIWTQYYPDLIGVAQTDYMLDNLQNANIIAQQINQGVAYFLVTKGDVPIGYFALDANPLAASAQLSKVYVKQEFRRHGYGTHIMQFIDQWCIQQSMNEVWLTVNRHNAGAIAFYEAHKFKKIGECIQDIGEGYLMDDYKMSKNIPLN